MSLKKVGKIVLKVSAAIISILIICLLVISYYEVEINFAMEAGDFGDSIKLYDKLSNLSDKQLNRINTYSDFQNYIADLVCEEVKSNNNSGQKSLTEMRELITAYKDILSTEQYTDCVLWYSTLNGVAGADNYISSLLKSPKSYYRYSNSFIPPTKPSDDGTYKLIYNVKYGATNSFGAEVTTSDIVLITMKINFDTLDVKYTFTK